MQNYPRISVIIVTYNAEKYLEQAILSVIGQDYPNLDFIIIDGKSTDGTVEIIRKYENYLTYWVSEPDKGIYDAMNKGIDKATGEWLYFLGSDDVLCEGILREIFEGDRYKDLDFIYGNVLLKNKKQVIVGKKDIYDILFSTICHQACFYRLSLFEHLGKYNTNYRYIADWVFNIKVMINTIPQKKLLFLDKVIAIYSEEGVSSIREITEEINSLYYDIFDTLKIGHFYKRILLEKPSILIGNKFDFRGLNIDATKIIEIAFKIKLKRVTNYFKKILLSIIYILHKPLKTKTDYKILLGEVLFPKLYRIFKVGR